MPTPTDLVTDLPADFEVFGQAVDSDFADLLGGTTGQILSKTSNTDLDFTWVAANPGDITGVTAGTGISGGGTSGDVTVTNSMATAIDAKGDLIGGTGADTFARLAVGANDTVLTADSSTATGLKWAAPSSGAMALVKRASFSNVANTGTTFDGVFTSSYKSYQIVIENIYAATQTDDLYFQFRYAGPTTQISDYYANTLMVKTNTTTITNSNAANTNQIILSTQLGWSDYPSTGIFDVQKVGNSSERPALSGMFVNQDANEHFIVLGSQSTARTYTGFLLKSSSTNIYGTIAVYGLV